VRAQEASKSSDEVLQLAACEGLCVQGLAAMSHVSARILHHFEELISQCALLLGGVVDGRGRFSLCRAAQDESLQQQALSTLLLCPPAHAFALTTLVRGLPVRGVVDLLG